MRATIVLALAALTVGCSDVVPPERARGYDFAVPLRDGFPLIFRWPSASLPVRVWAQPVRGLRVQTMAAIRAWQDVTVYGEFRGVLIRDSSRADIVVVLGPARETESNEDCQGFTQYSVELDTTITLPFHTTVYPRLGSSEDAADRCLGRVITHELGHGLGLLLHSDDPDDLMYRDPGHRGLSARDRATFTTLYHTAPTVRLPAGR